MDGSSLQAWVPAPPSPTCQLAHLLSPCHPVTLLPASQVWRLLLFLPLVFFFLLFKPHSAVFLRFWLWGKDLLSGPPLLSGVGPLSPAMCPGDRPPRFPSFPRGGLRGGSGSSQQARPPSRPLLQAGPRRGRGVSGEVLGNCCGIEAAEAWGEAGSGICISLSQLRASPPWAPWDPLYFGLSTTLWAGRLVGASQSPIPPGAQIPERGGAGPLLGRSWGAPGCGEMPAGI